jgi:FMN phosphatase YigB (HAD superfamily)
VARSGRTGGGVVSDPRAAGSADVVVMFDVDDTLLDNDRVTADLREYLESQFGHDVGTRYFEILEDVRAEAGYVDYLGALQRYRLEDVHDPRVLQVSCWLLDYPFAERLYPGALEVVERMSRLGTVAVLSDGDAVFQPRKVERSGLWRAFGGNVLIYVHKEKELRHVERLLPARRYVMIDDKSRILAALKDHWGDRVITVMPRQGHYANDPETMAALPRPDLVIEHIGDMLDDAVLARLTDPI